ncbi:MAG: hypothetical protein KatS3mg077_2170 [Candidatus Binatia bacterium]|nr:MAG: hypothetical protein KatS3mg077_2170 [Candidatus Binatia bacterium]
MKRQSVRRPLRTGKNGAAFALLVLIALPHATIFLPGCDNGNGAGFERCGNGQLDAGEQCDDGNLEDDDGCLSTCVPARCGDGFVASFAPTTPEQCDGRNLGSFCWNYLPELRPCRGNEDCPPRPEGPFLANPCQQPSCPAFGLSGGPLQCSPDCTLVLTQCGPPPSATPTPRPPTPTPTRTPRTPRTPTPTETRPAS